MGKIWTSAWNCPALNPRASRPCLDVTLRFSLRNVLTDRKHNYVAFTFTVNTSSQLEKTIQVSLNLVIMVRVSGWFSDVSQLCQHSDQNPYYKNYPRDTGSMDFVMIWTFQFKQWNVHKDNMVPLKITRLTNFPLHFVTPQFTQWWHTENSCKGTLTKLPAKKSVFETSEVSATCGQTQPAANVSWHNLI